MPVTQDILNLKDSQDKGQNVAILIMGKQVATSWLQFELGAQYKGFAHCYHFCYKRQCKGSWKKLNLWSVAIEWKESLTLNLRCWKWALWFLHFSFISSPFISWLPVARVYASLLPLFLANDKACEWWRENQETRDAISLSSGLTFASLMLHLYQFSMLFNCIPFFHL